jgi:heat-inducible transcriptional repressor
MRVMLDQNLNERAQHLLKVLIERYIRDGQPVGSRTLAENLGTSLSPATIRNVMAELEERGYIHSPHTSAGRIPTSQGYRFFVDSLLTVQSFDTASVQQYQQQLDPDMPTQALVASASSMLSNLTQLAGLVTLPRREHLFFRHVEFLPLSEHRVLVILVLNEREVQNRIIYTDRNYTASELQQAANYLVTTYAGKDLSLVRSELLNTLRAEREQMNQLTKSALEIAEKTFHEPTQEGDYVLAGQENLLELADVDGLGRLRQVFDAFTERHRILHLLDQCIKADGVQIYIGEESGYAALNACSLITSPYSVEGKVVGVLGVIGPIRMSYERAIQTVDLTAKLLSAALNSGK